MARRRSNQPNPPRPVRAAAQRLTAPSGSGKNSDARRIPPAGARGADGEGDSRVEPVQGAAGEAEASLPRPLFPDSNITSTHTIKPGQGEAPARVDPPRVAQSPAHADAGSRRVELILQQLDALPTLSAVAVRVLEMTSDDATQGKDVMKLVASDPALAAKVLKLVRCSERGRAANVTSVERAVVMLGFDALRSAVLSVQVFDILDRSTSGGVAMPRPVFDRVMFWQHSLAVAHLCEQLAGGAGIGRNINKQEAFTAGLLHDLGALALHVILPAAFDRVCEYAETNSVSLDHACRTIIGLDTHTAGRRLAEHWRLPHALGDVLWLNGQKIETLPDLPHRSLIALTTLADAIARSQCLAPAGHAARGEDIDDLCVRMGIPPKVVRDLLPALHQDVASRCESLGLSTEPTPLLLVRALSRANETIGRINAGLRQRSLQAQQQGETLGAIARFHDSASPGGSVLTVMGKVVESAASVFGGGFFAILYQARPGDLWQFTQFAGDGRALRSDVIEPPPGSTAVADLADNTQVSVHVMAMLPWLADYLGDAKDLRNVHLLPLRCGWGVNAVLLHDCAIDGREQREQLEALGRTWAAAIAAGAQHEGAKRLGERLAESNRALMDTQAELSRREALASLGEIAAGAAHEMNNPLCIISGRSQILAATLGESHTRAMAQQIFEQSHRLSDMITSLRRFAEPLRPNLRPTDLRALLDAAIADVRARHQRVPEIKVVVPQELPFASVDLEQMRHAIGELIRNAVESDGCAHIECRIEIEAAGGSADDRLKVRIADDGSGLTPHALAHAFDPFFSAKSAGRQPGLGLAHARRIVEAHGGQITLENARSGRGAWATIRLPRWRTNEQASDAVSSKREAA